MPSIHLPYVNVALDSFALIVILIVLVPCVNELIRQKGSSKHFLFLLFAITGAILADMIGWIGEGDPSVAFLTLIANTVASCLSQFAIVCFMGYLKESLYATSDAARYIVYVFRVLFVCSITYSIGNVFGEYAFRVDPQGHYVQSGNGMLSLVYLLFPILSFVAIILMALFAKHSARVNRIVFIVYTLFPVAGVILDYIFHGISLTYAGLTVSVLVIYTSIYLAKQKQIEMQKSALMLSQINPHFVYNTLSTIASMCDTSPAQAKHLTIDFSKYLRRNIDSLTSEALIPFEQEMEHVACYLKIEKARFRERLNVIYSIQCKDFSIPPLTVQPLVENAIKHGVTKKAKGGTVKISTFEEDSNYIIEMLC